MNVWTIYDHPSDYPDYFVVRRFVTGPRSVTDSGEFYCVGTLDEARLLVPDGLTRFERDPNDDKVIVESWL